MLCCTDQSWLAVSLLQDAADATRWRGPDGWPCVLRTPDARADGSKEVQGTSGSTHSSDGGCHTAQLFMVSPFRLQFDTRGGYG